MPIEYKAEFNAENRRFPRVNIQLTARFARLQPGELPNPNQGTVADLGAGGLAMISNTHLEKDQLITVKLYLPPILEETQLKFSKKIEPAECDPVTFLARVAWCNQDGTDYIVGLAVVDIDSKNKKRFKHFLVDYELDQPLKH